MNVRVGLYRKLSIEELMLLNCGVEVSWTARRSNESIWKEISPEYSLVGLMLKLKLQYFGDLMRRADSLGKNSDARKDWRQEKVMTEDEMVGWHQWLSGQEFEQAPGDGKGQGSLTYCSPWGRKESVMTEQLNNNKGWKGFHLIFFLLKEIGCRYYASFCVKMGLVSSSETSSLRKYFSHF